VLVQQRIEAILDWAAVQGYREGANPGRWKGLLRYALPATADIHVVKNHPALPYREIAGLVDELQARTDRDVLCLLLLIFTNTRVGAATGARMEEFDLDSGVWTIPASRMKRRGKRKTFGFRVPLSDAAVTPLSRGHRCLSSTAAAMSPASSRRTAGLSGILRASAAWRFEP
jgi:integrase